MKYGYPLKFGPNLLSEVEFAVKNFYFIEFTLELYEETLGFLPSLSKNEVAEIKKLTKNYKLVSHFDWDINPNEHLIEIGESIKILSDIGVTDITMHPYKFSEILEENLEKNVGLITKINGFCKQNNISLRIENDANGFFSHIENFSKLLSNFPELGITLDIGHANKTSENELDLFLKNFAGKIKHVHLHKYLPGKTDHLFFEDKKEFEDIISKIRGSGYDGTVTLETHFVLRNGEKVYLNHREALEKRREVFLEQLKILNIVKNNF